MTIFRDLSDDIHNLNATRFMTRCAPGSVCRGSRRRLCCGRQGPFLILYLVALRFKTELLRFGPPLSLRQAELLVCIATHLGFRSEAHGVLEKTVSP